MVSDLWQPSQYQRFSDERRQPFDELASLCLPLGSPGQPDGTVYDLGCGPGNLTVELRDRLNATTVIGIDASPAMLERAEGLDEQYPGVHFRLGDLVDFGAGPTDPPPDIIFSNAALHWADDHAAILGQWRDALRPGGQIAVQMPANTDHPSQRLPVALATERSDWFPDGPPALPADTVLAPEQYAQILHDLGAKHQYVALRVFPHRLDHITDAVEWMKGSTLHPFRAALQAGPEGETRFAEFCALLRQRLVEDNPAAANATEPYLYTFKRILMWASF